VRVWSDWRDDLLVELANAEFPGSVMDGAEFCAVELGLFFLTDYFPGEPIGALPDLLSGYVVDGRELTAQLRRLRHRMGDAARRGYWQALLNQYVRVPQQWRWFERTDDVRRRVGPKTIFAAKGAPYCIERVDCFKAALIEPLPYRQIPTRPLAEAGARYSFETTTGTEVVQLPDVLPATEPVQCLPTVVQRVREPWTISFPKDLASTAASVDRRLRDLPQITNRRWAGRLEDLRFSAVDSTQHALVDSPEEFVLDGIAHIVGLMNSGKTTLTDLIAINRVEQYGDRVGMVVASVGDVLTKVSFLRALGIDAVPLIGRSSREDHAARYWRTRIEETAELLPGPGELADPAAAYANASCLLEPFRVTARPDWQALRPADFPCRDRLRPVDAVRKPEHDCPLLAICPAQKAMREIAQAQVWVTTPQALIASRAEPAEESMRWLEAVQKYMDLLIVDEADAVQQVFDARFVQTVSLVDPDRGWSHRMLGETGSALARLAMAPAPDAEVERWHELLQIHDKAVFGINRLALSEAGAELKKLLGDAPFTAHSLLRRVCRMLFGLPRSGEGDKEIEDLAEDFYREHLQEFAEQAFQSVGTALDPVVAALSAPIRDQAAVEAAVDEFLDASVSREYVTMEELEAVRPLLRHVVEAAVWTGRITRTFFEMIAMYPSVRSKLHLPEEETFWVEQPPRDYRPLVPEAPVGNILALRWTAARGGGAALQLVWVHGVGRWLLHHAHDLLACEGIPGPHVILTSATSWAPGSSFYHIPITPTAVLRQPEEDRAALLESRMLVRPQTGSNGPVFVSGRSGPQRHDALRQLVSALCLPAPGSRGSALDELRNELPADRKKVLFVVLSGAEARVVGDHVNNKIPNLAARIVEPDAATEASPDGIARRLVGGFGHTDADILVAAELAIQRGYNILNANNTAALGAVIYLARSHPPPYDLAFPLSLVSQFAMDRLREPAVAAAREVAERGRAMRKAAHGLWFDVIGRPVQYRTLDVDYRKVFVANNLVPFSQTIGRSIRGNQPTVVLLSDGAFAERLAMNDPAPDTERTSIVVATDRLLQKLLTAPRPDADDDAHRLHAINQAVWGLMAHMVHTNDPLGPARGIRT
jgi:hypothetical protein